MDRLTGKLSWESTAQGVRIEILGWMGWRTLFLCAWLAFWIYGGLKAIENISTTGRPPLLLWLVIWVVAGSVTVATILWSFLGRVTLTLDPSLLNIKYVFAGTEFRSRSFPTSAIHNLRYRPIAGTGRRQYPGVVSFDSMGKTRVCASGIIEEEASALIAKMREVCPFS
jgi:hypothetical protein